MRSFKIWTLASVVLFLAANLSVASAYTAENKEPDSERYRRHAITVLKWLYPEDHELIDRTEIRVENGDPLGTRMCGEGCIRISLGTIRFLPNAFEYYAVLAHEFGHILGNHRNVLVATDWFTFETDFGLMERQELEADQIAIAALRQRSISPCYVKKLVNRFMKKYPPENDPDDPYRKIIEKRIAKAEEACRTEKEAR